MTTAALPYQRRVRPRAAPASARVWEAVAKVYEPRRRVRVSEWVEENVHLPSDMSVEWPGPYRCSRLPFLRDFHDLLFSRPGARGILCEKSSQVGITTAFTNVMRSMVDTDPAPILYLIDDRDKAGDFAEDFQRGIRHNERLMQLFRVAEMERRSRVRRLVFPGGRIDFAGAGSLGPLTSYPYTFVFLDEYERIMDNFPAGLTGNAWQVAQGRIASSPSRGRIFAWSHPRRPGLGMNALFMDLSDQSEWVFDCPHCKHPVAPRWKHVHYSGTLGDGRPDPETAKFMCPHPDCGREITDGERQVAMWSPSEPGHNGGSGRFLSPLPPSVAAQREFIGCKLHRLAIDPRVSIVGLARQLSSCKSEEDRFGFFTIVLGETYQSSTEPVSVTMVDDAVKVVSRLVAPSSCRLLTVGIDVQHPKHNPTLVTRVQAWTTDGHEFTVGLVPLAGWDSLAVYLRDLVVPLEGSDERRAGELTPKGVGIDCAFLTKQVLDFCRQTIVNAHSGKRIPLIPMRFQDYVKEEEAAVLASERKRRDPGRPRLGLVNLWDMNRHVWVDRQMRRLLEDRVTFLVERVPEDFRDHLTANVLVPVKEKGGWDRGKEQWEAIRRDDWAMAGVYGEAVASLECGLDQLARYHRFGPGQAEDQRTPSGKPVGKREKGDDYWKVRNRSRGGWW